MAVKFNSPEFYDDLMTDEYVLKHVSQERIYSYYIGDEFLKNRAINSPLRDDNCPSFSVFKSAKRGNILWKDHATGESGGVFTLVQRLHPGSSYNEAVRIVARDFGLLKTNKLPTSVNKLNPQETKKVGELKRGEVHLGVRYRKAEKHDLEYWASYGVRPEVLRRYHVYPVSLIFFNNWIIKAPKYCYAYLEYKDGRPTYKIYQPFIKDRKFISNNDYSVWEGWAQLPEQGDRLIITSSRKDVMSIVSTTGIPSIALQSENVNPKEHVIQQLKDRFKLVYILYDNDLEARKNWGIEFGKKLADLYGLTHIWIPSVYASKDYSDLVKNHGREVATKVLNTLLSTSINQ